MKQRTLFSVFTKNTTLNGTSSHLDHHESKHEKTKKNIDTLPKNTSKHVDMSPTQAESSLALDVRSNSNDNVRNTKVNELSVLDGEIENKDKMVNSKDANTNCKRQGKLSLSSVKKSNDEMNSENKSEVKSKGFSYIESSGKLVTAERTPVSLQSGLQDSKQNTSVGHSASQFPSDAVINKVVNSIDYADFLVQLAQKGEQKIQQNNEISTLCTGNERKQIICSGNEDNEIKKVMCTGNEGSGTNKVLVMCTDSEGSDTKKLMQTNDVGSESKKAMSYSEFLGMFKSPLKVEESAITIDDEPEKCLPPLPLTEQHKEIKCKSIASFFTKIESKPRKTNSSDVTPVTVIAEVHSPSGSMEQNKAIEPCTKKLPGKMEGLKDNKCEIEFLSSETIADMEVGVRKKVQGIKRSNEAASQLLQVSKKPKVEEDSASHKGNVQAPVKKSKNETPSDVSMITVEAPATSKKVNHLPDQDKTSAESANVEKIEPGAPVTTPATSAKSSQSTLHFGKSGFSLKKAAAPKIDTSAEEKTGSAVKILVKKPVEKHSSPRNEPDIEEERKLNMDSSIEEFETVTKTKQTATNVSKRENTSMACKEPAPSMQLLPQEEAKDKTETSEDTSQVKTEETSTLRRSARLAQSCHASKDVDVVEIISDEDDVDLPETKKRSRKAKSSATCGSPSRNWPIKSAGKLAPIFTSVKSKELPGKALPAPVDPEQDRLRREFLMSGIPDELKRQIATTAATTNLVQDYPPLPTISHVQQISVDVGLSVEIKIPKLCVLDDSLHSTIRTWDCLGWKKTQNTNELHRDPFKMFTSNPSVEGPHADLLLQELQCCDGKFPFRRTYEHHQSKVASLESASVDAAGIKCAAPTVIDVDSIDDDDDVIVCDDSHISELHPLKNTSDSKAWLWSDLHQPDSSEHIIGNTRAMKQLKEWLEEWKIVLEKQVRKASRISKNTSKSKNKGDWSDDSDFTDSEEEEETLCNSVLINGAHGIGKTASVYALAKELGYKVFEVNSSSLRSGKQLLAQLEEATQSHRVAQNKSKSAGISDTPPAGSNRRLNVGKGVDSAPKQKQGTSAAFANLFRLTPQVENTNGSASGSRNRETKLKLSSKESKNCEASTSGKITESVPARSQRKKKNEVSTEVVTTKPKKHKGGDEKVEMKSLANGDCSLTSGSLNLTSASLILIDEVDVVFEEDKGFLATVQHFMMSTKIPIVLTSTDAAFHLQLQARHDHIYLRQPPLVSAASFLSTVCLAHGVRISHGSVLNALHYTGGDIRRCLLNLQYWCESGGGVVQITKNVDSNSIKSIENIVNEKSVTDARLAKTFRSRMASTDDSNDSDFISLRPLRKKARQMTSDDDSSVDTITAVRNLTNSPPQSRKIESFQVRGKENKSRSSPFRNPINVIAEDASSGETCQLPLLHTGFEESLLGLHGCDMSVAAVMDFIQTTTFSSQVLDEALNTFSVITQALNNDAIYHVALHSLPLPKVDSPATQLTIPAPLEVTASELTSSKKSRKRIIQGDWMDSDSSDTDSRSEKHLPQDCTVVEEHSHENSTSNTGSGLKDEHSVNSTPESESFKKNKVTNAMNNTEAKSKDGSNCLTMSVLAEFTRYYDSLSYIDCLETKSSSSTECTHGFHMSPGLSDDETHSKLAHHTLWEELQCYTASVNVLSARQLYSGIGKCVKSYEQCSGGQVDFKDSSNAANCNDSDRQDGIRLTDWPEGLNLPLQKALPDLWSIAGKPQNQNLSSQSALKIVSKCLHPSVQSSDPALCLDYMPYLRSICRSEDERQLAKTQRRFHHYLNSIGLGLKESTIASLTSTYVTVPNGRQQNP